MENDTGFEYKSCFWKYFDHYKGARKLQDPRLPLIRHLQWVRTPSNYTDYSIPEPHNFNRATFTNKPVMLDSIKYQVTYRDRANKGWVTLFFVVGDDVAIFNRWIAKNPPLALWSSRKSAGLRIRKSMLWTKENQSNIDITDNERIWSLSLVNLEGKYFGDYQAFTEKYIGSPRTNLNEIIAKADKYGNE